MFHCQERKLLRLSWGWPFGLHELFIDSLSLKDLNIQNNFPASLAKDRGGWGASGDMSIIEAPKMGNCGRKQG